MSYLIKIVLTVIFVFLNIVAFGQKNKDFLVLYTDTSSGLELYGYKNKNGKIAIRAQYTSTYTDTLYRMAIVLKDWEWLGIDRNGKEILKPYIYDNGPDYVEEGLFRFVENKKIGFANLNGQKIIPAQYDFATPFADGISEYFIGGERIYENGKTAEQIKRENGSFEDLHWTWGGKNVDGGYINKYGQRFKEVFELKNNKRKALTFDNKRVLLNRNGKIIGNKKKHITKY